MKVEFPSVFSPVGEQNTQISRFKAVNSGKWSVTNGKGLNAIQSLAVWLLALGRLTEAVDVGLFAADHLKFTGNWDRWTYACGCLAVPGHASRLIGDLVTSDLLFGKAAPYPPFLSNVPVFETVVVKDTETSKSFLTSAAIQYVFYLEARQRGFDIGPTPMEQAEREVKRVLGQLELALT